MSQFTISFCRNLLNLNKTCSKLENFEFHHVTFEELTIKRSILLKNESCNLMKFLLIEQVYQQ